jgi:signal transduction histidine kinase
MSGVSTVGGGLSLAITRALLDCSKIKLADFILSNIEPILQEWATFARSIWPAPNPPLVLLRDHAEAILRATARDMATSQSEIEQVDKSKGEGTAGRASAELDDASKDHALGRVRSGFQLMEVVAEYRALRASVIRLWERSEVGTKPLTLVELTRFNECIDQSLAEAVKHFSGEMDRSRKMFLAVLGHDLRNPLNAIVLSAQCLTEILTGPSADLASLIATSGAAMGRMLADFIDFTASRLGAGIPLVLAPVDLATLCRGVVDECKAASPGSNLMLDLSGDLRGEWDGPRLRQLLSNLIGNAIQHGAKHLPVRITATGTAGEVILQIQNDGEPIPSELHSRPIAANTAA